MRPEPKWLLIIWACNTGVAGVWHQWYKQPLAWNRCLFRSFTVSSHLFMSNILDFPTGQVLFIRAQFLCTPVKSARWWSEKKKNKDNTASSVHDNGVKWGNGKFATPADMLESVSLLFNSLLSANLSLKSSGRRSPTLWAGTVGAVGQRSWRDHQGVMLRQISDERTRGDQDNNYSLNPFS